jgi:thiol-disulfide isomerase/thioredoxin
MRNLSVTITIVALLAWFSSVQSADVSPDWTLTSVQGQNVQLSEEVQQQPVVLLFWATYCEYCKALMPHLQSMRLEYGDSLKILAISFREKGDPVAFIQNTGYEFTVLPEGDAVATMYEVTGTPGLIIVDGEQQVSFDLRDLPTYRPWESGKKLSHRQRAAYLAPFWAAEIRKAIDSILRESDS